MNKSLKLLSVLFFAMLVGVVMAGCGKEPEPGSAPEKPADHQYIVSIATHNYSHSTFGGMFRLMTQTGNGSYENWSRTYNGTVAETDARAVAEFDELLLTIDNESICADLVKEDYMTATLERVNNSVLEPIKGRKWTATGYIDF